MIGARIMLTVAADLSANIFAAFLLVMIVVLAMPGRPDGATVPATLDVERDLRSVARSPLGPADLIAALAARRPGSGAVLVDLLSDRIVLRSASGAASSLDVRTTAAPDLGRLLAATPGAPVFVYVFDATPYATAVGSLAAAGIAWREISVPQALRAPGGAGWSAAFRDLAARRGDDRSFREGLARLLEGRAEPAPRLGRGGGDGGSAGSAAEAPPEDLLARLARAWRATVTFVTLAGLICVMILAEKRHRAAVRPNAEEPS